MSNHPEVPDPLQLELELHAPDPRFLALVSLRGTLISRLQQKLEEQARLQRPREAHEEWREIRDALRRRIVGQRAGDHWIAAAARRAIARALRECLPSGSVVRVTPDDLIVPPSTRSKGRSNFPEDWDGGSSLVG